MASLPSRHSQAPEMVLGGEQNTENTQAIVNDPTGKNLQDWDGGRKNSRDGEETPRNSMQTEQRGKEPPSGL